MKILFIFFLTLILLTNCSKENTPDTIEGSFITNTLFDFSCAVIPNKQYPKLFVVHSKQRQTFDVTFTQYFPTTSSYLFKNVEAQYLAKTYHNPDTGIFLNFGYDSIFEKKMLRAHLNNGNQEIFFTGEKEK